MSRPVTMAQVVRAFGMRRAVALARTAARAAGYLVAVRAALPGWLQAMLGVALVCTCLPGVPDFGLDEAIYLVAGLVLWFRHRALVRACWHAAVLDRAP